MEPIWTIAVLTIIGLALIAAEFFIFGFVLGTIGVALLLAAVAVCGVENGVNGAATLFVLEVVLAVGTGYAAIHYGPGTPVGRKMVLAEDQRDARAGAEQSATLVGHEGVAESLLRPSGLALVDGKRLDVVAESGLIERGCAIKVVAIAGSQIVVRKV